MREPRDLLGCHPWDWWNHLADQEGQPDWERHYWADFDNEEDDDAKNA